MRTAIYAGSFDPFTNGHLDVVEKATKLFDKVIILVANNSQKKYILPVQTRVNLIRKSVLNLKNVEVDSYDGLTVEYAQKHDAGYLIRGLRTQADYDYEMQMAEINTLLSKNIQTVFVPAARESSCISSSMVRELLMNKVDISPFVPIAVNKYFLTNQPD